MRGLLCGALAAHPCILSTEDSAFDPQQGRLFVVREWGRKGSLRDVLYGIKGSRTRERFGSKYGNSATLSSSTPSSRAPLVGISEKKLRAWGRHVLEALVSVRSKGLVVDSLHSGNVIVGADDVARISEIEGTILGLDRLRPTVSLLAPLEARGVEIDVLLFGHLLFELTYGLELAAITPNAHFAGKLGGSVKSGGTKPKAKNNTTATSGTSGGAETVEAVLEMIFEPPPLEQYDAANPNAADDDESAARGAGATHSVVTPAALLAQPFFAQAPPPPPDVQAQGTAAKRSNPNKLSKTERALLAAVMASADERRCERIASLTAPSPQGRNVQTATQGSTVGSTTASASMGSASGPTSNDHANAVERQQQQQYHRRQAQAAASSGANAKGSRRGLVREKRPSARSPLPPSGTDVGDPSVNAPAMPAMASGREARGQSRASATTIPAQPTAPAPAPVPAPVSPSPSPAPAPAAAAAEPDATTARFLKMLKMGLPRGAVEQKMRAEGADPASLTQFLGETPPLSAAPPAAPASTPSVSRPAPAPTGTPVAKRPVGGAKPSAPAAPAAKMDLLASIGSFKKGGLKKAATNDKSSGVSSGAAASSAGGTGAAPAAGGLLGEMMAKRAAMRKE